MAPTLKEVKATSSAAKATRGEIIAEEPRPVIGLPPVISSSDHSNEALATSNDVPLNNCTTSTTVAAANEVDEHEIPDDETAFTVPPHFSNDDPFHRNLRALDFSMRCSICAGLFQAPVTLLPCLHNFCSLCVRSHFKKTYTGMKRKANCPQCHEPVKMPGSNEYEKGIMPNKMLENQVDNYRKCRDQLREKLVKLDILEKEKKAGILVRNCQDGGVGEVNGKHGGKKRDKATDDRGSKSSKRARRAVAKKTSYASSNEGDDYEDNMDEIYEENVDPSNSKMPYSNQAVEKPKPQQLKRKPTVNYHNMNRKKLAELCKKDGLETHGNEKELKQRHSDYITLFNSECDSEHPRSAAELAKLIKNREKSIKMEANNAKAKKAGNLMKKFGTSLDGYHDGSVAKPTSGNASFDAEVNSNFARLIAEAKRRKQQAVPGQSGKNKSVEQINRNVHDTGDAARGTPLMKREESGSQSSTASSQQSAGFSEPGGIDDDPVSPTASMDSDKTVETPQKLSQNSNNEKASSPPSKSKAAAAKKRASSAKKPKPSMSSSRSSGIARVSSMGSWVCNMCTFDNIRNTTMKARCEMCNAKRPKETCLDHKQRSDIEVVNIDC